MTRQVRVNDETYKLLSVLSSKLNATKSFILHQSVAKMLHEIETKGGILFTEISKNGAESGKDASISSAQTGAEVVQTGAEVVQTDVIVPHGSRLGSIPGYPEFDPDMLPAYLLDIGFNGSIPKEYRYLYDAPVDGVRRINVEKLKKRAQ
jgi:hypothetical protein